MSAAAVAVWAVGTGGVAQADEPIAVGDADGVEVALTEPVVPPVTEVPPVAEVPPVEPPPAVGEVDGVPVAVAEAPVPGAAATVEVQAERVAVGVIDGVEVGVVEPPVPSPVVVTTTDAPVAPPAVESAAAEPTVALVLAAWG